MHDPLIIYDFTTNDDLAGWYIMDDVVMGGRSEGQLLLNEEGYGVFQGAVSLENNGGFSSVRYRPENTDIGVYATCTFRIKGDGKRYQFRVKTESSDRHSYISYFETSGEWETISILIADLYPTFRGRRLDMDNYPGKQLAEISFLLGNKKAEPFRLELDWMKVE